MADFFKLISKDREPNKIQFDEGREFYNKHVKDCLVDGYNNSYHNSIHMTPKEASLPKNENIVWYNLYGAYLTVEYGTPKFNIGDTLSISKYKNMFAKGYLPNDTLELFKIKQIIFGPVIVYTLEDLSGEDIEGTFMSKNYHLI
ncbi:uncharacterized protein LOC144442086 [Glandiceps talaboti]